MGAGCRTRRCAVRSRSRALPVAVREGWNRHGSWGEIRGISYTYRPVMKVVLSFPRDGLCLDAYINAYVADSSRVLMEVSIVARLSGQDFFVS